MQGRNENIVTLSYKIMAFNEKLTLWKTQVEQNKLTMFSRTAERDVDASLISLISESMMLLKDKLAKYFPSINVEDYDWVRNLFGVSVNEIIGLTFAEKDNLISLKNDRTMKLKFKEMTVNKFWIYGQAEFPEISIKAITILLPFSTSYLCEQGFSAVNTIKSKKRERLRSVEEELRVSLSTVRPRIKRLCTTRQAQISH